MRGVVLRLGGRRGGVFAFLSALARVRRQRSEKKWWNVGHINVLNTNRRISMVIQSEIGLMVFIVCMGFMSGDVKWEKEKLERGMEITRGEKLGSYEFGGACIIMLFERELIEFDDDLLKNCVCRFPIETMVHVRERIGRRRVQTEF